MNENNKTLLPEPPKDDFTIRCPRLGHQINFPYCRSENMDLPCFKTLDCWYPYFDVRTFLGGQLTKEAYTKTFQNKAAPKILSLLDLIEQAKQGKEGPA